MIARTTLAILSLLVTPGAAYALQAAPLPEPGIIELLAIGAATGVAVAIRRRRKK